MKPLFPLLAMLLAWPGSAATLEFFACGDLPYSNTEFAGLERLLASAAQGDPAFILHVGDIKAGSQPCTPAGDRRIAQLFARQSPPVFYTPGDNEWTDCRRASTGERDPFARLLRLRQVFFADPEVLHHQTLAPVVVDAAFPENLWFRAQGIVFALVHIVGSHNAIKLPDPQARDAFDARALANRTLLRQAAQAAQQEQAPALVVVFHVDPLFERPAPGPGLQPLYQDLATLTADYAGSILVIHGDTHRYRFDQPWKPEGAGARLWRLEVPGSPFMAGVWVKIDPAADPIFAAQVMMAPAVRPGEG